MNRKVACAENHGRGELPPMLRRRVRSAVCATLAALLLNISIARAVVVTDNFTDANDTASPVWTHLDGMTSSTDQIWDASSGAYRLYAPSNGTHPNLAGYGFVGSYTQPSFQDVRVTADIVDFTPTDFQGTVMGVAARLNGDNDPFITGGFDDGLKGYAYQYEANANNGNGEMVLTLLWAGGVKDIGSQKVTLSNANDYRFVLEVIGTAVHGQVFRIDTGQLVAEDFRDVAAELVMLDHDGDGSGGTPEIPHVPYTDGFSGLYAYGHVFYRDGDATFDNYRTETAVAGDYNRDGSADAADYVLWRKTLGSTGPTGNPPTSFGRLLANGVISPCDECQVIDEADYQFWISKFGGSVAPGSGASGSFAVPEPTSMAFLLLGLLAPWCRRARPN